MSHKDDTDNHANQLNPEHDAYWESRGYDGKPDYYDDDINDDLDDALETASENINRDVETEKLEKPLRKSVTSHIIKDATDLDFERTIHSSRMVLVYCWAPWCGPARKLAPTVKALAEDYAGKVAFYWFNTEKNHKYVDKFRILNIPTLLIFLDGKLADTIIGAVPRQYIEGKLKTFLK